MIASEIEDKLPPGVGFTLLLFNFGEGGYMTYSSNSVREDMIKALLELMKVIEKGEDNRPEKE